jgi:A118 family predicted phage portal protein
MHIPIAGDIAAISADLLFADAIKVVAAPDSNPATQVRLDGYLSSGLQTHFREAAEVDAAMGGVYLRVVIDPDVQTQPWVDMVQPENAVPEWRYGRLVAVTFWKLLSKENGKVLRHLERHESGAIFHGLYSGNDDELGRVIPLTEHPYTAGFVDSLTAEDYIETGITKLTAVYVPNIKPNRVWRNNSSLIHFGRSDFDGIEPMMDALDEVWSSWMRDIRLGKGRVAVDQNMLQSNGRGQGATLDLDKEIFVGVPLGPSAAQSITPIQFQIRTADHDRACQALIEQILRSAGYSSQSYSDSNSAPATATEISAREQRSLSTRGQKINYWAPAIRDITQTMLMMDNSFFGAGVSEEPPAVEFSDAVSEDPQNVATTLNMLSSAQAVSTQTKVQMLHPDWNEQAVAEEVARISGTDAPITVE